MNKKTLDSILSSVINYEEIAPDQDIIFEGHGERDSSGKVISQHGSSPEEISKIASKINKPKNWHGCIVLLGSCTADLTEAVSYEYYKLTNESVTVVGPKYDLIVEYVNDQQTIIGIGWADNDPNKPEYIDFAKNDIYTLDKLVCDIDNKLNYFKILFGEFFDSVLPTYSSDPEKLKIWFQKLNKLKKLLANNIKYLDLLIPSQNLDESTMNSWKEIILTSKLILTTLLKLCNKSNYVLDDKDMTKLIVLNELSYKLKDIQKGKLPHLFYVAENLIRIFNISTIQDTLDLSNPQMVKISRYTE